MTNSKNSQPEVRLMSAALDDAQGTIVLRGVLDPASLSDLKVGAYQREVIPHHVAKIAKAFRAGQTLPDIDLGCRGGTYREGPHGTFLIADDVYVVDGQQRRAGALSAFQAGFQPQLGAMVHFNTDEAWERARFEALNGTRLPTAPSVRLRNLAEENSLIAALLRLCHAKEFPLYQRVCWQQNKQRNHLIHGATLLKVSARLHGRLGSGLQSTDSQFEMARGFDLLAKRLGMKTILANLQTFWTFIDEAWEVRTVTYAAGATHLRLTFLFALAELMAWHEDFWNDSVLTIDYALRKKLASFPLDDPTVRTLASAGGKARQHLVELIVDHVNHGKRSHRLTPITKPSATERGKLGWVTRVQIAGEAARKEQSDAS